MTAGRSAEEEARRRRERARQLEREAENFERGAEGERRVAALLDQLPEEFVVFHDLQLPGSRANVDHLVVGPAGAFVVDAKYYSNPVTMGRGRGADTLWTARTPLRRTLETTVWEASRVSELLAVPVAPVMCMIAPELPAPSFDFGGVRICSPECLHDSFSAGDGDLWVDVAATATLVEEVFGVAPAPNVAPIGVGRGRDGRAQRARAGRISRTQRLLDIADKPWVRFVAGIAALYAFIALVPAITNVLSGAFQAAGERAARSAIPTTTALPTEEPELPAQLVVPVTVPDVGYEQSCAHDGSFLLDFSWPGALPDGVGGYDIRWRVDDGPTLLHTLDPWTDPDRPPPQLRIRDGSELTLLTEHRDHDDSDPSTEVIKIGDACAVP